MDQALCDSLCGERFGHNLLPHAIGAGAEEQVGSLLCGLTMQLPAAWRMQHRSVVLSAASDVEARCGLCSAVHVCMCKFSMGQCCCALVCGMSSAEVPCPHPAGSPPGTVLRRDLSVSPQHASGHAGPAAGGLTCCRVPPAVLPLPGQVRAVPISRCLLEEVLDVYDVCTAVSCICVSCNPGPRTSACSTSLQHHS